VVIFSAAGMKEIFRPCTFETWRLPWFGDSGGAGLPGPEEGQAYASDRALTWTQRANDCHCSHSLPRLFKRPPETLSATIHDYPTSFCTSIVPFETDCALPWQT
jgi:hypothetical protein